MSRARTACVLALAAATGWVLYANAWLVDDAYITFRTVDNFVHGRGLTWNPGERVQAFTHPLWMLLVSVEHAVTGELFYTVLLTSMALTIAAVAIGIRALGEPRLGPRAAFAVLAAITAKAVMDYGSSGLEGPLSYLLVALLWLELRRGERARLVRVALFAALAFVNRPDTALIGAPAVAWAAVRARRRGAPVAGPLALGAAPAVAWLLFALFYFGFPFPNTFYAKVSTGAPLGDRLARGVAYLGNSLRWDPAAHAVLALATVLAVRARRLRPEALALVAGLWLYVGFAVTNACATHMSGRLLAVPLFAAAPVLCALCPPRAALAGALALVAFTLWHPRAPWKMSTALYLPGAQDESRIDTSWFVHREGGTLRPFRPAHPWLAMGAAFRASGERFRIGGAWEAMGWFGYAADPDQTLIDVVGLTDPLVARLPACNVDDPAHWKSGHFYRELPAGYLATRVGGRNVIVDPALRAYLARLDRVTRGPLLDGQRLRDILQLNLVERRAPAPPPPPGDCRTRVWRAREELAALLRR